MTESSLPSVASGQSARGARPESRGDTALAWWRKHCHPQSGDPGTRARLRRARSSVEALRVVAAASLARQLGAVPKDSPAPDWRLRAAVDLARVLAHVQEHTAVHPMKAAGWKSFPRDRKESEAGEDRPVLSGARFRRLLETGDGEEKVAAFTRLIALLGGTIDVARLAADFLNWNHPTYGDRVREHWTFVYLAASDAAPALPSTDPEDAAE